jgi:hypothetical protein
VENCSTCGKPLLKPVEAEPHEQIHHRGCWTDDSSVYFTDEKEEVEE